MKKVNTMFTSLLFTFLLSQNLSSQIQFTQHTITNSADNARSVFAVDLDDDSDIDVLSASFGDDKISWYENDGNQNFTMHIISDSEDGAICVFAIDLDKDNDLDVLSSANDGHRIVWFENDGSENFTAHVISTNVVSPYTVMALDLDKDNDVDVISASHDDNKIAWYENDGNQNFTQRIVSIFSELAVRIISNESFSLGLCNIWLVTAEPVIKTS